MNVKKYIAARAFKDREGREHKVGDRVEVDPDYGVELIRKGDVKEDPEATQLPADPAKAQPK